MDNTKVDEEDVMEAARCSWSPEKMEQIKFAVLEKNGSISIIPYFNKLDVSRVSAE